MQIVRFALVLAMLFTFAAHAADNAPWGTASVEHIEYHGEKVVYDVTSGDLKTLNGVLDRAGYLSRLNGDNPLDTSIVIVLHGDSIPVFAIRNYPKYKALMIRAQSLSTGDVIRFDMCAQAAKLRGFTAKDIHGFVHMVPMADAEIVRLQQQEGYAYMR